MLSLSLSGPAIDWLKTHYQSTVQTGFQSLKHDFTLRYQVQTAPGSLRLLEIRHVTDILSPPLYKKLRHRFAAAIGAKPARLDRMRQEVQWLLKGQNDQIISLRSPAELNFRAQGPFYETEAYFHYLHWLEIGRFRLPKNLLEKEERSRLNWQGTAEQFMLLLDLLQSENLLPASIDTGAFKALFEGETDDKLVWCESNVLLLYLFEQLMHHQFIPLQLLSQLPHLLPALFLDKHGHPLKAQSLAVLRSKTFKAPRNAEKVEAIIQMLLKS